MLLGTRLYALPKASEISTWFFKSTAMSYERHTKPHLQGKRKRKFETLYVFPGFFLIPAELSKQPRTFHYPFWQNPIVTFFLCLPCHLPPAGKLFQVCPKTGQLLYYWSNAFCMYWGYPSCCFLLISNPWAALPLQWSHQGLAQAGTWWSKC